MCKDYWEYDLEISLRYGAENKQTSVKQLVTTMIYNTLHLHLCQKIAFTIDGNHTHYSIPLIL